MMASCILAYLAKVSQGVEGVGMIPQWNRTLGVLGDLDVRSVPPYIKLTQK